MGKIVIWISLKTADCLKEQDKSFEFVSAHLHPFVSSISN